MLWIVISACIVLGTALIFLHVKLLNGGLGNGSQSSHRVERCPWCMFPVREFRKRRLMKFQKELCPNCGRLISER